MSRSGSISLQDASVVTAADRFLSDLKVCIKLKPLNLRMFRVWFQLLKSILIQEVDLGHSV